VEADLEIVVSGSGLFFEICSFFPLGCVLDMLLLWSIQYFTRIFLKVKLNRYIIVLEGY
jgi:hypothetical protein